MTQHILGSFGQNQLHAYQASSLFEEGLLVRRFLSKYVKDLQTDRETEGQYRINMPPLLTRGLTLR